MKVCSHCKKEVTVDKYFSRKSVCSKCGNDLHICLNCRFYKESAHNKCLEPKTEFLRSREKANFCDYFDFREDTVSSSQNRDAALKKLNDLFSK
ncbi:MAG: hypothetical protein HZA15_05475 [Nitrospirae bacterium]|nr:hypothetical protein [Nitrospirota bacterium]